MQSFSYKVKSELCRTAVSRLCCARAEAYGVLLYLYLARDLTFGAQHPDEDEFLNVERIPFDELLRLCLQNEVQDAKTVAAVLKAKLLFGL